MPGKLKICVLYDRWEPKDDEASGGESAVLNRTLDKKEVEEEVAEALTKLGHEPVLHQLDGSVKTLHALTRLECDLVFNLSESFAGDDTADAKIAGYLELIGKRYTGSGTHGLLLAQDKTVAKKIFAFHQITTPVFARSYRGRLAFSHDLDFPVIVKPAREDGSIGVEFNSVVSSIKELMDRGIRRRSRDVRRSPRQREPRSPARHRARSVEAAARHAPHRRHRGEVGQGHGRVPRHQIDRRDRSVR
jgi:D-alanine-D-alanine ligase